VHPLYGTQRARRGPTTTTPYLGEKRLRFSETSINTRTPHSQRGRSVGPVVLPTCSSRGVFVWLVADDWCWFVLREKYCWLVAGG
jgi:hypothetical protein